MSRVVASTVLGRRFGSCSRKAVALVLADHADADEWHTIIGQPATAAEAELSVRQVRRILTEFEAEGLIVRKRRHRKDGTRTSDHLWLVQSAIEALPHVELEDTVSGRPRGQDVPSSSRPPDTDRADYRTSDAPTTGQAMSAQEPSEEPSEEPPAAAVAVEELPAIRWARRWAELRQVTFTATVQRSWAAQVQEFIRAGGTPTEDLLRRAHREGIREPKAWAYVTASIADSSRSKEINDWMADR